MSATPTATRPRLRLRRAVSLPVALGAIIVAQVITLIAIAGDGFFKVDDYLYFSNSMRAGGWTWAWLGSVWWKHFAPLDRASWLVMGHATPGAWAAYLAFQLTLLVVGLLAFYGTLKLLFGRSYWLLLPVALVGLSAQWSVAFAWPSHGLMAIPEFASQMVVLYAFLKYLRTRNLWWLPAITLGLAFGLGFYVRTLLIIVVVATIWLLWLDHRLRPREVLRALRRDALAWAALLAPALLYVAYYAHRDVFGQATPSTHSALVQMVRIMWLRNIWPRMLGVAMGPAELTSFQRAIEVIAQLLLIAAVAFTVARKRAAIRAWVLIPIVLVPSIWMVAEGRLQELGPGVGADYRYVTQMPWVISLAFLFAFHPRARLVLGAAWPQRERGRSIARAAWVPAVVAVVALAALVEGANSIRIFDGGWGGAKARAYVHNLTSSADRLASHGGVPRIEEAGASPIVQGGYPMTRTDIVMATGAHVGVGLTVVPDAILRDDGTIARGSYSVDRTLDVSKPSVRRRVASGGAWVPAGAAWCLRPTGKSASLTWRLRPKTSPGEAIIDMQLGALGTFGVALDTGTGLPHAAQKSVNVVAPGRNGVATGVNGLRAFRIDVPAGQQLCLSRMAVGVFRAPAP